MRSPLHDLIDQRVASLELQLIATRRELHQFPELSNREFRTSERVATTLRTLGLSVRAQVAKTGVVALLEGSHPGPTLAVRADMDALPILELNEVAYRSRHEGVKHACGHDVHTAIALGLAQAMSGLREHLHGNIKFIFQPAEEGAPAGETGGASVMIEEGVLESPRVEAIFALHVMPTLDVGKVGYHTGAVWAGNDTVEIVITGRKTHAAYPHTGVDAIFMASHAVVALQSMISREMDARDPMVLSIGVIEGGNQYNVLAERVRMAGVLRCLSSEVREAAQNKISEVLAGITGAFGGSYTLNFTPGAPVTQNHPTLLTRCLPILEETVGKENVFLLRPSMGAEDFACFAQEVPGFYFMLGVRNEQAGITHMLHTPLFDVDEKCLLVGAKAMGQLLAGFLEGPGRAVLP
ncbi:MAG: amidohydrolase [Acidobacteriota bacterium]